MERNINRIKVVLVDKRKTKHYKNIIYIGDYASGTFNGYISWLNNIGKCFKESSTLLTLLNIFLHILSSNEWNVMTHILPPTSRSSNASFKLFSNTFNSNKPPLSLPMYVD